MPPLLAGVFATLAMQIGRPLVEFLVSPAPVRVDGLLGQAALVTVISSMLALPVFLLVRRVLLAAHAIAPLGSGEASA